MPKKNYVADYIFATQVAKNAGNTTNLSKVMGHGHQIVGTMRKIQM